jgi:XTP/dITP diphosphohydrolase
MVAARLWLLSGGTPQTATMAQAEAFLRLVKIMDELREQCPWDRKQTIQSLRQLTIEETFELADAITDEDWNGIREELGDLMLHLVFYAKIGTEQGRFTLEEVLDGISDKLIARHPHIYGDVKVKDEEEVKANWEKLKLREGKTSILGGVPRSLPAMVKAMRLQEKVKQVGFEWEHTEQVWDKVEEEMGELQEAVSDHEQDPADATLKRKMEEELGDLFFSLINYARFLKVDAENALELTNRKFMDRFSRLEKAALEKNRDLNAMTLEEMNAIWEDIKKESRRS